MTGKKKKKRKDKKSTPPCKTYHSAVLVSRTSQMSTTCPALDGKFIQAYIPHSFISVPKRNTCRDVQKILCADKGAGCVCILFNSLQ